MINLKTRPGNPKFFESTVLSHPVLTGSSYVEYTLNLADAGFTEPADQVFLYVDYDEVGTFVMNTHLYVSGTTLYNFWINWGEPSNTTVKVRVYRLTAASVPIKFRAFTW